MRKNLRKQRIGGRDQMHLLTQPFEQLAQDQLGAGGEGDVGSRVPVVIAQRGCGGRRGRALC